ncbi:hypothetical protein PR202_ga00697 [Eleusine coracana subsp. coracana]|uniref:Clp R domain-containing protein n=1 Tax=Eleusine coracana subsp. coracana TaxID=191504 RepID=A0AAV5BEV3_ELECO|nr:hypothetical protein PR202_ga00697 [Eleusine coracana subsp. coracana]
MRAGGYTVHQSLTAEAAAVLKQALGLARGRGHAQVTPLHVAFTLLGSSSSAGSSPSSTCLLRRACAKAHPGAAVSSSQQSRALELCFNVALNRLPTAAGSPTISPSSSSSSSSSSSKSVNNAADDVDAILEVMSSRKGRRSNPVVVADSAAAAEFSVAELMRRLERGAHVLRLHLSRAHVRLMARADVDALAADLRRTAAACANATALIIYVGDMRWAVDDAEEAHGVTTTTPRYSPAQHMAAALARLLGELRARCWLVAAASYGTYARCQRQALDATWALQPVYVHAGDGLSLGLALGPRAAASPKDNSVAKLAQFPVMDLERKQEDGPAALCVECTRNFDREASAARAKAQGTNLALSCFPGWPQANEPQTSHADDLNELKRKWRRLCQMVHLRYNHPARPSTDPELCLSFQTPTCHGTSKVNHHRDIKTTLSLLLPDSAVKSDDEVHRHKCGDFDCSLTTKVELPFGDLKRKAESDPLRSEFKRRRGSVGALDLNLCPEEEEDDADGSEDEPVPSDLTNDGEGSSDDMTGSLHSHN